MPVANVFYGSYCGAEQVIHNVVDRMGYEYVSDAVVVAEASKRFGMDESKIWKALSGKTSIFNKFTREKEQCLAYLKPVLADFLKDEGIVLAGQCSLMVPRTISHILNICIIAEMKFRISAAAGAENISEKDAAKRILRYEEVMALWVEQLYGTRDPWAAELYDIVIPMNKLSEKEAVKLICENLKNPALTVSDRSLQAVADFALAAEVNLKLVGEGHNVTASASKGVVLMEINKHVLMLSSLEEELKKLALSVGGVVRAETKVGPGFYVSDIYRKFDLDVPQPSKVLLVDDEREFVETLSERLQMRDYGSAAVYGGEEALTIIEEDEPDVMVLDLKMPGIDGLEVLRRVKEKHPNVEVIVLTGHGSQDLEKVCLELGACAYLEKPVDIEKLTMAMQEAYERVRKGKTNSRSKLN